MLREPLESGFKIRVAHNSGALSEIGLVGRRKLFSGPLKGL
jgi:hypothetical protein